jgi:dihydroneopterin aldolase/D-erythro-7,8-dihydroneopterin triphosphate epimerase
MGPDITTDRIHICDLQFDCIIGVNPEERTKRQRIVTNIEIYTDLAKASANDSIEDTISYSELADSIVRFARNSSFTLIEKLAEEIARICLEYEKAAGVKVVVNKPGAIAQAAYAGVEIYRTGKTTP